MGLTSDAVKLRQEVSTAISKDLENIGAYGYSRTSGVFEDFVYLAEASLRMLPYHAESMAATEEVAEDDAAAKALWERLRKKYDHRSNAVFAIFTHASKVLYDAVAMPPDYIDILGPMYMEHGNPNSGAGQFFTPWHLCQLVAQAVLPSDIESLFFQRLAEALAHNPAYEMIGSPTVNRTTSLWLAETFLPAVIGHFNPITVHDPCVGSGGMLLAGAESISNHVEDWVLRYGLIQFTGQDIDPLCAAMARTQMMLFGLNGYSARLTCSAQGLLSRMPSVTDDIMVTEQKLSDNGQDAAGQLTLALIGT